MVTIQRRTVRAWCEGLPMIVCTGLVASGCHGDDAQADLYDQTFFVIQSSGVGCGTLAVGSCGYCRSPGDVYLRFGSDGTLSVVSLDGWSYICGSTTEETWSQYPSYCKTLNYTLGDPDEDGDMTITLDHDQYDLWSATVSEYADPYTLSYDAEDGDYRLNSYYQLVVDDELHWSDYTCIPEAFDVTDEDVYAPELGTGESPE